MTDTHWFDTLPRVVARSRSRREALRSVAVMLPALLLGPRETAAKAKGGKDGRGRNNRNNKKGKGNSKGNGKGQGSSARCDHAICAANFAGDEIGACTEKCGRCRIDGQFCVIGGDPIDPTKVATCCFEDQQCCQDTFACCNRTAKCCSGYPEI